MSFAAIRADEQSDAVNMDSRASVPGLQPHTPVEHRIKLGQDRRKLIPLAEHARWKPPANRRDPIEILIEQDKRRLQDLVPIRYGRMLENPFAFYRGAAAIMASDLSYGPQTGVTVQLAGDAHLDNFGAYGTPERQLVFDVNDFDETLPGSFEMDVKRLAASVVVAARNNGFTETDAADAARAVRRTVSGWPSLPKLATRSPLLTTQLEVNQLMDVVTGRSRKVVKKQAKKARSRDNLQALNKMCTFVDGQIRIADDPPLVTHVDDWTVWVPREALVFSVPISIPFNPIAGICFERYSLVDGARKVVGVGSVGTRCFILLFKGASNDDPLFFRSRKPTPQCWNHMSAPAVSSSRRTSRRRTARDSGRQRHLPGLGNTRARANSISSAS